MTRRLARVLLGLVLAACGRGEAPVEPGGDAPRAVLIEPAEPLAVARVGEVVLAVRTPAGHRALAPETPVLEGAEVIGVGHDVREVDAASWLHRTVFHVRPLQGGDLAWPDTELTVESPQGERSILHVAGASFHVASILGRERPDRAPYGLRLPPSPPIGGGFGSGLLAGGLAGGAIAWLLGRRRWRAATTPAATDASPPPAAARSGTGARAGLEEARRTADHDPRAAAGLGAAALRRFVSDRFSTELQAATTEELSSRLPAAVPTPCRDALLRLLGEADRRRFQPASADALSSQRVKAWLDESEHFVERWSRGIGGTRR